MQCLESSTLLPIFTIYNDKPFVLKTINFKSPHKKFISLFPGNANIPLATTTSRVKYKRVYINSINSSNRISQAVSLNFCSEKKKTTHPRGTERKKKFATAAQIDQRKRIVASSRTLGIWLSCGAITQ